ncbi:hypothetical protein BpHYR1_054070 [Brachionus plicatilis]|uniref:Uncharacterized protein n=1 Tax=Brachionus plicatilis TaxID=10195 RepID=A0A3M7QYZ4_BRAPC|nr:hypothetical protein BpHYR1_054070 [Brachionus plicatilis]
MPIFSAQTHRIIQTLLYFGCTGKQKLCYPSNTQYVDCSFYLNTSPWIFSKRSFDKRLLNKNIFNKVVSNFWQYPDSDFDLFKDFPKNGLILPVPKVGKFNCYCL